MSIFQVKFATLVAVTDSGTTASIAVRIATTNPLSAGAGCSAFPTPSAVRATSDQRDSTAAWVCMEGDSRKYQQENVIEGFYVISAKDIYTLSLMQKHLGALLIITKYA